MYPTIRYLSPVRNVMRILSAERSPRQIAAAVALGMMIGLLPKGNLVAAGLTVLMFSLKVNLGVGLTTAFVLTFVGSRLDPLTHGIGARMLNNPTIYQSLVDAYQRPIVPWTALNNTVVLGALTLGLVLCFPVYHITHLITVRVLRRRKLVDGEGQETTAREASSSQHPESTNIASPVALAASDPAPVLETIGSETIRSNLASQPAVAESLTERLDVRPVAGQTSQEPQDVTTRSDESLPDHGATSDGATDRLHIDPRPVAEQPLEVWRLEPLHTLKRPTRSPANPSPTQPETQR